jgi:hypothetical protein
LTDAAAQDLFLIALATLDLLGDAAAGSPLMLIAEDAQWLDRATADVLTFVARRLSVDPIVLLIAVRDGCEDPFGAAGLPELRVRPLDDESARESVAAELEAAAMRARRRGATIVAVSALERAAELGERSPERARRLLSAAELAFELGRPELAIPLLANVESLELSVLERGRMTLIRELVDPHPFEGASRCRWLVGIARSALAERDVDLALDILWLVASRTWWKDPGPDARRDIAAAVDYIESAEGPHARVPCRVGCGTAYPGASGSVAARARVAGDGRGATSGLECGAAG